MARSTGTQMELKCESVIIDEKRLRYWEESEFKDALSFADDKLSQPRVVPGVLPAMSYLTRRLPPFKICSFVFAPFQLLEYTKAPPSHRENEMLSVFPGSP